MTTVEIMFRKNFFLNDHGEVISYAVLVAEDYTKVRILKIINLYQYSCMRKEINVNIIQNFYNDDFFPSLANNWKAYIAKMAGSATVSTMATISSV